MANEERDPLWFKDAVIYEAPIRSYYDANGDGKGDFRGMTMKLDHLQQLGVDCIWLLPMYPSPLRDDGYDIADFISIHPDFGTVDEFQLLIDAAHARGMRVIADLVMNHTSDQHSWFQEARHDRDSPKRDYYVWTDDPTKYSEVRIIFTDTEPSNWTFDPVAGQYFWHRFFTHQPDLNYDNPAVWEEMFDVARFWLKMGLDGFRCDAVPYLYEREGTICENLPETHVFLAALRAMVDQEFPGKILLAEANQWPEDVIPYFGTAEAPEFHMSFHFPIMPRMYMSVKREERSSLVDIMNRTPDIREECQWAIFLRNHDELTLEMVTEDERQEMWREFAPDRRMRCNLGIRRRLAPLVDNGRAEIELLNIMLFSMRGTPCIYYGDEIGMGDDIYLRDRNGVRTPMQWSAYRNAGFSEAGFSGLFAPVISDSLYGYQSVNVETQSRTPTSLLNWMKRAIRVRKQYKSFGRGTFEWIDEPNERILAFIRAYGDERIVVVINLSSSPQVASLDLSAFDGARPIDLFGNSPFPPVGTGRYNITLGARGYFWLRLDKFLGMSDTHTRIDVIEECDVASFLARLPGWLATALPAFLPTRRWFGDKARSIASVEIDSVIPVDGIGNPAALAVATVHFPAGDSATYLIPAILVASPKAGSTIIAELVGASQSASIVDGLEDEQFRAWFVHMMLSPSPAAGLVADRLPAMQAEMEAALGEPNRLLGVEQSNSSIAFGFGMLVKVLRRLQPGVHPDVELTRFLTSRTSFSHVPHFFGSLSITDAHQQPTVIAFAQRFVESSGDGWSYVLGELQAAIASVDRERLKAGAEETGRRLGEVTAELHLALSSDPWTADVAPEPIKREDADRWSAELFALIDRISADLSDHRALFDPQTRILAETFLHLSAGLRKRNEGFYRLIGRSKARVHGDYHLGQTMRTPDGDFIVIDFEGEPLRTIHERRQKISPLKDVAGMLRSFGYARGTATAWLSEESRMLSSDLVSWEREIRQHFVSAYISTVTAGGGTFLPAAPGDVQAALAAWELDKAAYEVVYELNNRPDWLWIPLSSMLKLAEPEG